MNIFDILDVWTSAASAPKTWTKLYDKAYCPSVARVIDNNPTTIVYFTDGSKSVVKCSEHDTYNLETAILYAIVKRTFGKLDAKGEAVESAIGNSLKKIVETMTVHTAEINAEKKLADDITKGLNKTVAHYSAPVETKKTCCCSSASKSKIAQALNQTASEKCCCKKSDAYVRPNKPFSQFTIEEKRAYWRAQKRRASK